MENINSSKNKIRNLSSLAYNIIMDDLNGTFSIKSLQHQLYNYGISASPKELKNLVQSWFATGLINEEICNKYTINQI